MKTITKIIVAFLIVFGAMTATTSCKKESIDNQSADGGYMTVKMTDAPADYSAVNVEIVGMMVNTAAHGWINVPVKRGIYNLLELRNDVTVALTDDAPMPIGEAKEIRLMLGTANTIVTATGTFPLKTPSAEESGLKIKLDETIASGEHVVVVLDFDAEASVVVTGNNQYILKPVIKVKTVTQL